MVRIVITDLDGSLLDHVTYDFTPALPALRRLQEKGIPVVFCSSKTAAEVRQLRQETGNRDPFIVENGGGIYIPRSYFSRIDEKTEARGSYLVTVLGRPVEGLKEDLVSIAGQLNLSIRILGEKVAAETGLTLRQARWAMQREFDVCFEIRTSRYDAEELESQVAKRGLKLTRGGRYLHLTADSDKGRAAGVLLRLYRREYGRAIQTIGVGDSRNDLDLLRIVDLPVVIPNPHTDARLREEIPTARRAIAPGPVGWNAAMLSLLQEG